MSFAALRTMVAGFLTDTCTIRRPGRPAYDREQGIDVITAGDAVYAGACRLRPAGGARVVAVGEGLTTLRMYDLTLPWDTEGIQVDQVVTLEASNDPHIVDRTFTVTDVMGGTDGAYRRCLVEEIVATDEGEVPE